MTLAPRLAAIANLIPPGSRVCDVGTDHGQLPVWLLKEGRCPFVIATDLNPGPLETAKRTAKQVGIQSGLEFRLADGLAGVAPHEVDTVVIAGMGGETIAWILGQTSWLPAPGYRLILQPQSKLPELMKALAELGCRVQNQHLVEDAGKLYTILEVTAGQMASPVGGALYVHQSLLARGDPLLGRYLTELCRKFRRALDGLEQAAGTEEKQRELKQILTDLEQWKGEASS